MMFWKTTYLEKRWRGRPENLGHLVKQSKHFRPSIIRTSHPWSAADCWALVLTGNCDGNQVKQAKKRLEIWTKTNRWLALSQKVAEVIPKCLYEKITFIQNNDTDEVFSVTGTSNHTRSKGHAAAHAIAYVWKPIRCLTEVVRNFQLKIYWSRDHAKFSHTYFTPLQCRFPTRTFSIQPNPTWTTWWFLLL